MAKATQQDRLLGYLSSGLKIDRLTSFNLLGIIELSARVIDLENRGCIIDRKRKTVTNRFDENISVMEYWMEDTTC